MAGALLYKPHWAMGFFILWAVRGMIPALVAFGSVAVFWLGLDIAMHGFGRYRDYLALSAILLRLPRAEGFPAFALVTPYGLITGLLPEALLSGWISLAFPFTLLSALGFAVVLRQGIPQPATRMLAILLPFLVAPYGLLHDLVLLAPLLCIWAGWRPSTHLFKAAFGTYVGSLLLPLLGAPFHLALPSLIPIGVFALMIRGGLLRSDSALEARPCADG